MRSVPIFRLGMKTFISMQTLLLTIYGPKLSQLRHEYSVAIKCLTYGQPRASAGLRATAIKIVTVEE